MISPGAADIAAAKSSALKRFGSDRIVGVTFEDPISGAPFAEVLLAALTLASAGEFYDAKAPQSGALLASRLVWPSSEELEPLRAAWPAFDVRVESAFLADAGFTAEGALEPRVLSLATAPAGLSVREAEQLLSANAGLRLWAVERPSTGLACVIRQPAPEVWSMSRTAIGAALSAGKGTLCPAINMLCDHCVWSPTGPGEGLRQHLEESPGRAADLSAPWADMGGAGAKTSARRF